MTIDAGNVSVGALTFNNPGGGSYTLAGSNGSGLTLASGGTGTATLTDSGGNQFISAPLTLGSNLAISTTSGSVLTISAAVGGVFNLTTSGSGLLVLSGANSFSGSTTPSSGSLQLNNANAVQNSTVNVAAGDLVFGTGLSPFNFGGLSGSGNLTLTDAGGSPVTIQVGGNAAGTVYSGGLAGLGGLTKVGGGVLTLSGNNTYAGTTTVSAGTLAMGVPGGSAVPTVYYPMNLPLGPVASGATVPNASPGGAAFNGTVSQSGGGTTSGVTSVGGEFGQAISLPGNGAYVNVPYASALALSTYTLSLWVNIAALPAQNGGSWSSQVCGILATRSPNNGFYVEYTYNSPSYEFYSGIGNQNNWFKEGADYAVTLTPGAWNMITYTVSPTGYAMYFDGVQEAASTWSSTPVFLPAGDALEIGIANGYMNGAIDDVCLFGSVLSQSQIAALYTGGGPASYGQLPAATPLVIAGAAAFDLGGLSQTVASLANGAGGGGIVTNSGGLAATLTLAPSSGSTTFGGVIQDGASQTALTLNGAGTQVLTGSNTYSGLTTISAGTLQLGSGGGGGSINGSGGVVDNGTLAFAHSNNVIFAPAISGSGGVTQMGGGVLALYGSNTYTGPTQVSSGTLQAGVVPPLSLSSNIVHFTMDGTLGLVASGTTFADASGHGNNGTMEKSGASFVSGVINQAVQFAGNQYIQVPYSTSLSTTVAAWTNSVWIYGPSSGYNEFINARHANFSNGFSGGFDEFYQAGTGNNYFYIEIPSGGSSAKWLIESDIYYNMTPNVWHLVTTTVQSTGFSIYVDGNLAGTVAYSGTPALMTNTTDYLTIGDNSSLALDDFNLYNAVLTPSQIQTIYWAGLQAGLLPATTPVQLAHGAVLQLIANQTIASLADGSGGGGTVTSSATGTVTLTLAPSAGTTSFSGVIQNGSGGLALALAGTGTQILAGSNTYSGATTISGGTLQVGSGGSAGSIGSTSGVSNSGVLAFDNSGSATFASAVSGTGSLVQMTGDLILTGSNTYSGATTISGGTLQVGNGSTAGSISGSGNFSNSGVLAFDNSGSTTFASAVSGTGSLVQMTGDLVLTGSNTYSGATTISGGTLQVGSGGSAGSIGSTSGVSNSGVLAFDNSGSTTFASAVSGTGSLVQMTGNLVLTGSNTYSGATTISGGTLQVGSGGSAGSISGSGNFSNSGVLEFDNQGANTFASAVSGTGSLVQMTGNLILTGSNTYRGATTISGGTLQVGNGSTAGSISGSGNFSNSGVLEFDNQGANTFASAVSGTGSLVQMTGDLILTGGNTYRGATTISGGTLQVGSGGSAGSISGSGNVSNSGVLEFDNQGANTFASAVSGTGSLVQMTGNLILTGANAYSGGSTLSGGTLQVGNTLALGSTAASLTVNSPAELDLHGFNVAVGQLSGSGLIDNRSAGSAATLALAPLPGTTTFSGTIEDGSGTVALLVSGSGMQVLTGVDTYGGGTTVSSGTLDFANPDAMPSTGLLDIQSGGWVVLGVLLAGDSAPATAGNVSDAGLAAVAADGDSAESTGLAALLDRLRTETASLGAASASLPSVAESAVAAPAVSAECAVTGPAVSAEGVTQAVPEPSMLTLLGIAAAGLLGRLAASICRPAGARHSSRATAVSAVLKLGRPRRLRHG